MSYGIAYTQTGGPFKGMKLALMEDYGVPLLFQDFMKARTQARDSGLHGPVVVQEAMARRLVGCVVEYYSGRRTIQWKAGVGSFVLANEERMSYEQFCNMQINFKRHREQQRALLSGLKGFRRQAVAGKVKMRLRYTAAPRE